MHNFADAFYTNKEFLPPKLSLEEGLFCKTERQEKYLHLSATRVPEITN